MSSGNRGNWGNRKPWGGRGRGGFGGRDRGSRGGVNKNYRGHSFGNNRGFRGGRQNDYGGRGPPQPFQNYSQSPRDTPGKRLSEEEIGVTEYINDHEGFLGVIKSRYSDFQVSEINLNGEIAKLTNTKPPQPPVDKDVEQDEDLLLNKYNVEILPMDEWDRINKLAVSEASSEKVEIDVTGMSKEERTKIHDAVKKAFGDSIVGSTVGDGDKKLVRFERYRKGGWLPHLNPFTRTSRDEPLRGDANFNSVPYGEARTMSNNMSIGTKVPYNLHYDSLRESRLSQSDDPITTPRFTQLDSSKILSDERRVGAVSTVPLFTRRGSTSYLNDGLDQDSQDHRKVGPSYPSRAQNSTQFDRYSRTMTPSDSETQGGAQYGRVVGPAYPSLVQNPTQFERFTGTTSISDSVIAQGRLRYERDLGPSFRSRAQNSTQPERFSGMMIPSDSRLAQGGIQHRRVVGPAFPNTSQNSTQFERSGPMNSIYNSGMAQNRTQSERDAELGYSNTQKYTQLERFPGTMTPSHSALGEGHPQSERILGLDYINTAQTCARFQRPGTVPSMYNLGLAEGRTQSERLIGPAYPSRAPDCTQFVVPRPVTLTNSAFGNRAPSGMNFAKPMTSFSSVQASCTHRERVFGTVNSIPESVQENRSLTDINFARPMASFGPAQALSRTQFEEKAGSMMKNRAAAHCRILPGVKVAPSMVWKNNSGDDMTDYIAEQEALPTDTTDHTQSIAMEDNNDAQAVSEVLVKPELDPISVQFEADWTIQFPENKIVKRGPEPIIEGQKKKLNRKQRRKLKKQLEALENNTNAISTYPEVTLTDGNVGEPAASIIENCNDPPVPDGLEQTELDPASAQLVSNSTIPNPETINERKSKKSKKQRRKAREQREAIVGDNKDSQEVSEVLEQTELDPMSAQLVANWTIPNPEAINERKRKKTKKQRRKAREQRQAILGDGKDSQAVSEVLEQTELDPISAQLVSNWTIPNPETINERKRKKSKKQRRKTREQRQAMEIAFSTYIDASANTAVVPYSTLNKNTILANTLEISSPNTNEDNPNISRKRNIEEAISLTDIKRQKLCGKESKPKTVSRETVFVDNIDNSVDYIRQKTVSTVNITYPEALKLGLIVSITTLSRNFSPELSEEFQQHLVMRLMEEARQINDRPGPAFRGKPKYVNGALRLWCEDEATLAWLAKTTSTITLSTGDKVVIMSRRQVEPMVRCAILLPGVREDFSVVARVLRFQNPWAEVDRWKLHRVEKQVVDTFVVISVPESMVKTILEHERRLCYMLGSVYIKFEGPRGQFLEYPPLNVLQNMHRGVEIAEIANQVEEVEVQCQSLERTDLTSENVEFENNLEKETVNLLNDHLQSGENTRPENLEREEDNTRSGNVEREEMPEGIPSSQL